MYTGTAKFTRKSVDNEELTCKNTGPPVEEVLEKFAGNRLAGKASLQQPLCFHGGGQENKKAALPKFSDLFVNIDSLACLGP